MKALVDADIVAFRCSAVNEESEEGIARWQVDELMSRIMADTGSTSHTAYLSGDNNFRKQLYPEYKANRLNQKRPKWLEACRSHLVTNWDATITDGYEADDALGMEMTKAAFYPGDTFACCSIDKELLMIPGDHYNFVKQIWTYVDDWGGLVSFYTSLLVGDAVDNIKGCPGIGKAKAPRLLENAANEWELYQACLQAYNNIFKEEGESQLTLNAKLLWIWREMDEIYQKPVGLAVP